MYVKYACMYGNKPAFMTYWQLWPMVYCTLHSHGMHCSLYCQWTGCVAYRQWYSLLARLMAFLTGCLACWLSMQPNNLAQGLLALSACCTHMVCMHCSLNCQWTGCVAYLQRYSLLARLEAFQTWCLA